jgi:hypothetical protein
MSKSSSSAVAEEDRAFDVVVYGATGFTGGLVAEYMAQHAPADVRWALAGRSQGRLEAVRTRLTQLNDRCCPPIILANASGRCPFARCCLLVVFSLVRMLAVVAVFLVCDVLSHVLLLGFALLVFFSLPDLSSPGRRAPHVDYTWWSSVLSPLAHQTSSPC